MTTFTAFDSFIETTEAQAKGFELKGQQYTLPAELPASAMLRFTRKLKGSDQEQQQALITAFDSFFMDVLGEEQYTRLLETGISLTGLKHVYDAIMDIYNGKQTSPKAKKSA